MKTMTVAILAAMSIVTCLVAKDNPKPARNAPKVVVCVGDSITFGSTIKDRKHFSYPVQLQNMLGDGYKVINAGVSGRTLLKKGDLPYWKTGTYKRALKSNPDFVIIKLGTNDTKPQNYKYKDEMQSNLKELAESFVKLPSKPVVFLATPVPVQRDWKKGINEPYLRESVLPAVYAVAKELKLPVIDFHSAVPSQAKYFNDGVHPNKEGAKLIAQAAKTAILKLDRK